MGDSLKLCMGCMNPLGDGNVCSSCGYIDNTPFLPSYLAPKTVLNDRYIVGKLLNYNGEGATYIGYDRVINTKVQIREYYPDTLCTRILGSSLVSINQNKLVQYKNLMSEFIELNKSLMKMRTLSHICSALDVFQQNNTSYVILEYIDGISLKHYLQDNAGELSWQQAKKLFSPVFTTLSLIHNSGIIHRGLSLDTIYVTQGGELKITGFCTPATRTSNSDIAPELFAGYAAPEQYSSNNWQGTWTDVYSISAVLYRVLTGCMPAEAISRIGNDSLIEPSKINYNVPLNISKVIMTGLKVNGEVRIQTITELVTKLFEQPDFIDQPRNQTTTIIIPKQSVPAKPKHNEVEEKQSASGSRIFLIVMAATFLCAFLILLFVILFISGDDENKSSNNDSPNVSVSVPDSSFEESSDVSSETTSDSDSSISESTALIRSLIGSKYDSINEFYLKNFKFIPTYEYNEDKAFPDGVIFEQDVKDGTVLPFGSKINVKVSKGSKYIDIPTFEASDAVPLKEYTDKLTELGIPYTVEEQYSDEFDTGLVIRISRTGKFDKTSTEKLVVYASKGKQS